MLFTKPLCSNSKLLTLTRFLGLILLRILLLFTLFFSCLSIPAIFSSNNCCSFLGNQIYLQTSVYTKSMKIEMINRVISLFFIQLLIFSTKISGTIPLIMSINVKQISLEFGCQILSILLNEERSRLIFA